MVPNEHSDEVIVRQVQSGDKEAFGILVERYEEKLRRYGKKFLASEDDRKDLLQDIFLKAYMNIQEFDADRRFSPWLYRIAHNEFVNALKRRKPILVSFFDFDALFPHAIQDDSLESSWSEQELKVAMDRCLEKLDLKYREPIILHYYDEMDYKGIADVLQIPISTVGVRLSRGRALLKKYYESLSN
jgi:RNA polymerase sigma-70 factor (ECF subfamily)